ncbi:cytochrome c552 [Dinoroseobacter shibae DFL 12 = DSM 16493]|jgi:cytochrome c|uniref:Cytochrome c552 n=1 Tax=Dinoroseobacter shibae (strain DSM 16493 / NCIMB 14021 / DFL 12) TaxID=398580 RepID=A8LQB4_DINSH|nr:cytochrome c family protein [Dinoroseobacter shibae]ABV92400.1 cytochrome c552 [Dinoroseobacter shibae DFL 12 = DSM 16493]URF47346.1 cytochrome c family protein [Dinoroseobacter shibae]URF51657.1 cytochrome c family protein [Dinoroseobacter shibae]
MFDTMTMTKIVGGFCGALLVFLLGTWASSILYGTYGGPKAGENQAYVIDTGEEEESVAEAEEVVELPFAEVYAAADAGAGERLWRQCQACHKLEAGANGVGPYLHGIVDRPKHAADGYAYSDALLSQDGAWTPENISAFLENPREYAPGTKMAYRGMPDVEDRANLIAYLATYQ